MVCQDQRSARPIVFKSVVDAHLLLAAESAQLSRVWLSPVAEMVSDGIAAEPSHPAFGIVEEADRAEVGALPMSNQCLVPAARQSSRRPDRAPEALHR